MIEHELWSYDSEGEFTEAATALSADGWWVHSWKREQYSNESTMETHTEYHVLYCRRRPGEPGSLEAEIARLRAGDFTKEEIHNFCHNLHDKVSVEDFAKGCEAEMVKLYGRCPWSKTVTIKDVDLGVVPERPSVEEVIKLLADMTLPAWHIGEPEPRSIRNEAIRIVRAWAAASEAMQNPMVSFAAVKQLLEGK